MLLPLQMLFVVWLYRLERKQDEYLNFLDHRREEAEEDVLGVSGKRLSNMCACECSVRTLIYVHTCMLFLKVVSCRRIHKRYESFALYNHSYVCILF